MCVMPVKAIMCAAQPVRYLYCSGLQYYSMSLTSFFFSAEEPVTADVCNDFVGLNGKNTVTGSAGFGFFGWGGQGLCFSLNFWQLVIEFKNEKKKKQKEQRKQSRCKLKGRIMGNTKTQSNRISLYQCVL